MWVTALLAHRSSGQGPFPAGGHLERPARIRPTGQGFVIWIVDRWRKKAIQTAHSAEELTDFRGMFERGEITEEEYVKLRTRVSGRMKQEPVSPTAAPPTTTAGPAAPSGDSTPQNPPPPA